MQKKCPTRNADRRFRSLREHLAGVITLIDNSCSPVAIRVGMEFLSSPINPPIQC
jgi:hypothetical protein